MNQEEEQLVDLGWARDVLQGIGDSDDNPRHALWLVKKIESTATSDDVRTTARSILCRAEGRCYLNENAFCFLRAQQEAR
jgi:hypothetical protein